MAFERKKKRKEEEEHMGELNLVPYLDIITNVVMFMLATITAMTNFGIVPVTAPSISEGADAEVQDEEKKEEGVVIAVGIGTGGFYVGTSQTAGGAAPPKPKKGEPDILKTGDKYNYAKLTQKMAEIKKQYPKETKVFITADPPIPYEVLIDTMDAVRDEGENILFPNVILTIVE
jgi:biopolymer transport protein ExbD